MDADIREAFQDVRNDIKCLERKVLTFIADIAVLKDHDQARSDEDKKRINVRVAILGLFLAAGSLLLKYVF